MKIAISILSFILILASASAARYSSTIDLVLEQLRHERTLSGEPLVSGRSYGYGGSNGAFFLLGPYVLSRATAADVIAMREDTSPIVRILAAKIMSEPAPNAYKPEAFDVFLKDKVVVLVGPLDIETNGYKAMTVADVVLALRKDAAFLPLAFDWEGPVSGPITPLRR